MRLRPHAFLGTGHDRGARASTKLAAALSILILVDRGRIALDERVAHYWPEFAQGGKERVTVREAITHRAGVPGFDPPISAATACDWEAVYSQAAAEPLIRSAESRASATTP